MPTDSPEDRLLRLIKEKDNKKGDAKQILPVDDKSFLAWVGKKIFLKNKLFNTLFQTPINIILTIVLFALLAYLAHSLLFPAKRDISSIIQTRKANSSIGIEPETKPISSSLAIDRSAYLEDMKGKELFGDSFVKEQGVKEGMGEQAQTIDISKRFNLVGIIAGAEPQAIIEDKDTHKTYYLYKGQSFNGVIVEEIGEGKVVLNYEGGQITLVL